VKWRYGNTAVKTTCIHKKIRAMLAGDAYIRNNGAGFIDRAYDLPREP
jgi:hypothetical protein